MTEWDLIILEGWKNHLEQKVQELVGKTLGPLLAELGEWKQKVERLEKKLKGLPDSELASVVEVATDEPDWNTSGD